MLLSNRFDDVTGFRYSQLSIGYIEFFFQEFLRFIGTRFSPVSFIKLNIDVFHIFLLFSIVVQGFTSKKCPCSCLAYLHPFLYLHHLLFFFAHRALFGLRGVSSATQATVALVLLTVLVVVPPSAVAARGLAGAASAGYVAVLLADIALHRPVFVRVDFGFLILSRNMNIFR